MFPRLKHFVSDCVHNSANQFRRALQLSGLRRPDVLVTYCTPWIDTDINFLRVHDGEDLMDAIAADVLDAQGELTFHEFQKIRENLQIDLIDVYYV